MSELIIQVNKGRAEEARTIAELYGAQVQRILQGTGDAGQREFHRVVNAKDEAALVVALNTSDAVNAAYLKPADTPPPASPAFESRQVYLGASPGGVDARYAWSLAGGKGAGVKLVDIEYAWHLSHQDLSDVSLLSGVMSTDPAWRNHGTAILGIIKAPHNNFGVSGIAPDTTVRVLPQQTLGTAQSIRAAADYLGAGDVMLLEAQRPGPRVKYVAQTDQKGYIPIEWWPDDYEAIKYATDRGIVVVSAGANGQENLDDALYNTPPTAAPYGPFPSWWRNPFDRNQADSGSLVIGAGEPPPGTHGVGVEPGRSKRFTSNHGLMMDAQAWGAQVTTLGYGTLYAGASENEWYTDSMSGSSAAAAIVAGCVVSLSGALKAAGRPPLSPAMTRRALRSTGASQVGGTVFPTTMRIGSQVDLKALLDYFLLTPTSKIPFTPPKSTTGPGRLGTFIAGYSRLGMGIDRVIEPYPQLHAKPVYVLKPPAQAAQAKIDVQIEKINGFSDAVTLRFEGLLPGFSNPRFDTGFPTRAAQVNVTLDIASDAPYQGAILTLLAEVAGAEVARSYVFIAVAPPGFCVVDGLPLPVTEAGFQSNLEVLGDKARARDGGLQSTVRGIKRSWTFQLELSTGAEYTRFAKHLFTNLNRVRLLSGLVVAGEAVPVLFTPQQPDFVKVGNETMYRLKGQLEER